VDRTAIARGLAAAALLLAGACTGSPVPEPPNVDPPDLGRVEGMPGSSGSSFVVGAPGAAAPDTTLWAVNLDGTLAPSTGMVAADGSFSVPLFFADGDEVRLQVRDAEGDRSVPVDAVAPAMTAAPRSLADCLRLEPPLELDFGAVDVGGEATDVIRVTNDCGAEATVALRLRVGGGAFALVTGGPLAVTDGEAADVTVSHGPSSAGPSEEILFIEASAPSADRRPVTLIGEAR